MVTRNKYFYEDHPKNCASDDYWGQVKRTVNGQPVAEDQIKMIVAAIVRELELKPNDRLLDLCCGNGALTERLAPRCGSIVGVDFSEHLIAIAKNAFAAPPAQQYFCADAVDYVQNATDAKTFTVALCYGAFMFFHEDAIAHTLRTMRRRFPAVRAFMLGNLPHKGHMDRFFKATTYQPGIELDPDSPTGVWRHPEEVAALAGEAGWNARFSHMPEDFYAAAYRYDAVLTPRAA